MDEIKAVVFDIDETLTPEVSWLSLTSGLGASADEHARIFADYIHDVITYEESRVQLISLWRSTGNANKTRFAKLFDDIPLDPHAKAVAEAAKQGREVCIITGSMDLYAESVARRLGIAHWYANTTLHWNIDGSLRSYDYVLDQPAKKLQQLVQFCAELDIRPQECAVVGDGANDAELFAATGHGILLDKSESSTMHAWQRAHSLRHVCDILSSAH